VQIETSHTADYSDDRTTHGGDPLTASTTPPRIYYLAPRLAGSLGALLADLARIRSLGFSHLLLAPPFASAPDNLFAVADLDRLAPGFSDLPAEQAFSTLGQACAARGLSLGLDLVLHEAAPGGAFAGALPGCWREAGPVNDPRIPPSGRALRLALEDDAAQARMVTFWRERLSRWKASGISFVRCHEVSAVPLPLWRAVLEGSGLSALGWMPGAPRDAVREAGPVFDALFSSAAWWHGRDAWLVEEYNAVRWCAPQIAFPEDPFGPRLAERSSPEAGLGAQRFALNAATLMADGWLMPMGFEFGARTRFSNPDQDAADFSALREHPLLDLSTEIIAANARMARLPVGGAMRRLSASSDDVALILRTGQDADSAVVALNCDPVTAASTALDLPIARLGLAASSGKYALTLLPGGAHLEPLSPIASVRVKGAGDVSRAVSAPRIMIEAISPSVDGGRFPVKRIVGDAVEVTADVFADGHEVLGVELRWRAVDEKAWSSQRMTHVVNDIWRGSFPLLRPGSHEFAVEAWWDEFGTFRRDLIKKRDAGLNLSLEIAEGALLLDRISANAAKGTRGIIRDVMRRLQKGAEEAVRALLSPELQSSCAEADPRRFATGGDLHLPVEADREAAGFASWYELFPRSETDHPGRHGTFDDVIARLPAIREMGFDVLYFPPIHPIGLTNRKGRNNSLDAGPDDPGSPYAIGSAEGGHEAIHPELGDRAAFRRLVQAAAANGLEIALDFAIQCSPDHPWLKQHPDWFEWRPDGSMKYAENPPKKYQDIVNVDFYAKGAMPALWLALRDVVQGWVDQGVRTFRVDNPHTKPFPFWEWLIADIRSRDPGVIFLAEAFTRPKIMYRLGKVGFSQSYTYFTWRNTKHEFISYLEELNSVPVRDLYRPHFFVNTPDINPYFLHASGRPGFLIRAALAATLSGLWGVYSGFELCESAPVPGKEEYLDSEKYEIRPRDWSHPVNIIAEITKLNAIRKSTPALQSHLGVTFHTAYNDQILYYAKQIAGSSEMILVAVSLDPHAPQSATIEIPLWEFGLPDDGTLEVEDLMEGHRFRWTGKHQTIRLDPAHLPFAIWRVSAPGKVLS